jgi:hypothetical protein
MLKAIVTTFFMVSLCIAQSSSDGSFSVRHITKPGVALTPAQMQEAEKLYRNACAVVKRDFHSASELRPQFAVILGADHDEVHGRSEIWLKKWSPAMFTQGVVVVAFDQVLTADLVKQLAIRAVQYSNATINVMELQQTNGSAFPEFATDDLPGLSNAEPRAKVPRVRQ